MFRNSLIGRKNRLVCQAKINMLRRSLSYSGNNDHRSDKLGLDTESIIENNSKRYECCQISADRLKYCNDHSSPISASLKLNAEETTNTLRSSFMISGHVVGRFLSFLVDVSKSKRILEIGTYSGYSAIALAQELNEHNDNLLVCIDNFADEPKSEDLARKALSSLKVNSQLRKGRGMDELHKMVEEKTKPFDFVFVDADKSNQLNYFHFLLDKGLLKRGGILCVDNTLWYSRVLQENVNKKDRLTKRIKIFNDTVATDNRVTVVQLPIRDGITLIKRK